MATGKLSQTTYLFLFLLLVLSDEVTSDIVVSPLEECREKWTSETCDQAECNVKCNMAHGAAIFRNSTCQFPPGIQRTANATTCYCSYSCELSSDTADANSQPGISTQPLLLYAIAAIHVFNL